MSKLQDAVDEVKIAPEKVITPEMVESIAKGANLKWNVDKYEEKLGTQLGDNFMSIMYSVGIDVSSSDGKKERLQVMVKTMPKNAARVAMINDAQAFVKEIKMYREVLPAMIKFQKECGLSDDEIFSAWPKCYAARYSDSGADDYIALQDLRPFKYGMACRREGLGLEESKFVMRYLGKFHALSYAQYQGNYDNLKAAYPYLKEKLFQDPAVTPEVTKQWLRETFTREAQMLRDHDSSNLDPAEALECLFSDTFWENMHRLTSCWTEVAVIGHSDTWTNNFLFQFEAEGSRGQRPIDLKFVDFQLCRVGSRCLDLAYFLYTSPQIKILNENEHDLLAEYFESFKSFATRLGHFDQKLTLEQLKEEFGKHRIFGVTIGCMLAPILTAQSGDIPDLESMPEDANEMMSEESKEMWFGNMKKEQATYQKVLNMAKFHIPKFQKELLLGKEST